MLKTYKVKWYDWNAGHYNEKECYSYQLNQLFSKLNTKSGISDITIFEVNTIESFKWTYWHMLFFCL